MQLIRRNLAWMVSYGVLGGFVLPLPAMGQGQRPPAQQLDRMLILAPVPTDPGDSATAVAVADAFRSRIEGKTRRQWAVISKDRIGEALEASGFSREAILDASASDQLARFLQADAYIMGRMEQNSAPTVHYRLVDLRRTGLSGWVHFSAPSGATPADVAEGLAGQMDPQLRAANSASECVDRRDRRDFSGAKDRARRAFESVPNHASAAMCLAVVFEAVRDPVDSQIVALEMAVKGDSTNTRAWEMLGRQYQVKGDTLKAAEVFQKQLDADPTDSRLRMGIAALLITQKQYEQARVLIDKGLESNPTDVQALQLKVRACKDGSLWPCLLAANGALYELDSSLTGNAQFYLETFAAAQSANDTLAQLRWSGEAVSRIPDNIVFWRARASALKSAGRDDSALVAYQRIAALDSTDIAAPLQIAEILLGRVVIDTTVPLDTATLRRVDVLLARVATLKTLPAGTPADTGVWMNVAARYFQPGAQLVQKRVSFPVGTYWLEQSLKYDVRKQLATQANFFLGLAYFFQLGELDARLRETKSCALVVEEADLIARAKAAMTAGASLQAATATQIIQYLTQYEGLIPNYKQSFKCP